MPKRAIFLDRDGTLIEEIPHLHRVQDVRVYPKAFEVLRRINRSDSLAVVITNQSAIARGLLTEEDLQEIHRTITGLFRENSAWIDSFYYCPHHPQAGSGPYSRTCRCRKPEPGLLLRAARDLEIELAASHIIGDRLHDVEAGHRAGCKSILVKTGYGREELLLLNEKSSPTADSPHPLRHPDYVAENILDGVKWILEHGFEGQPKSAR
ncbi:HAD-IIIA family hydrolase [Acidobacteria bacterium AH-259-G07]|nr:HAD-IIIA family hydrolase [Acidobacteria bacterium AH-259-G07]